MIKRFVSDYLSELKEVLGRVPLDRFEEMVGVLLYVYEHSRSVFVMGNGESGSTASHFIFDINKGVSFGLERRFVYVTHVAIIRCLILYSGRQSLNAYRGIKLLDASVFESSAADWSIWIR